MLPQQQQNTVTPNSKIPPKNKIQKFVKLTDRTDFCNYLTNFEGEAQAMTGNGSYVDTLKLSCKKLLNKNQVRVFFGGFYPLGITVRRGGGEASADLSQPRSPYAPGGALARAAAYYLHKLGVNGW